jgi:hypothetical protein
MTNTEAKAAMLNETPVIYYDKVHRYRISGSKIVEIKYNKEKDRKKIKVTLGIIDKSSRSLIYCSPDTVTAADEVKNEIGKHKNT